MNDGVKNPLKSSSHEVQLKLTDSRLMARLIAQYYPRFWAGDLTHKTLFRKHTKRCVQAISFSSTSQCYEMVRFVLSKDYEMVAVECGASVLPAIEYPVLVGWFSDISDMIPQASVLGLQLGVDFLHWSGAWLALGPNPREISQYPGSEEQRTKYLVQIFETLQKSLPAFVEKKTMQRLNNHNWSGFVSPVTKLRERFGDSLSELRNSSTEKIKELLLEAGTNPILFSEYERLVYNGFGFKFVKKKGESVAKWIRGPEFKTGWLED